jgi:hypothetical protein
MRRVVKLGGAALLLAACAGGIRPAYAPFAQAVRDTIQAAPPAVVTAMLSAIAAEGMRVQWQSPAEGYIETQWYDLVSRQSGSFDRGSPERFIKLRFFVDPMGTDASTVIGEAVSVRTVDPSVLPRDAEMMLPPGHAGRGYLDRVLGQAKAAVSG